MAYIETSGGGASGAGSVAGARRLALIGDSQTAQNNGFTGSTKNNNRQRKGWMNWFDFFHGNPFYHPTGADTTGLIVAAPNSIDCLNGSPVLTFHVTAHGLTTGDAVTVAGATAFGGFTANTHINKGFTTCTVIDANTFTVTTTINANADLTSQGGAATTVQKSQLFTLSGGTTLVVDQRLIGMNAGVASDHTVSMKARFQTDVLSKNPDIIIGHGGTNDLNNNVSAAEIFANVKDMIDRGLAAGALVVWQTVFPKGGSGSDFTASQKLRRDAYNRMLKDYGERTKNLIVVDHDKYLTDHTDGTLWDEASPDGLHLGELGSYWQYLGLRDALRGILPPEDPTLNWNFSGGYDATNNPYGNILTNGLLASPGVTPGVKGTGVSGTVADNWTVERASGTNLTAVCSMDTFTLSNGKTVPTQKIVVTCDGLGTSGNQSIRFRPTTQYTTNGAIVGGYYEAAAFLRIGAASAPTSFKGVYGLLQDYNAGAAITMFGKGDAADNFLNVAALGLVRASDGVAGIEGTVKSDPMKLTNVNGVRYDWKIEMPGNVANTVTVEFANMECHRMITEPPFTYLS